MESRSNSSTLHRRYSVGPDLILPKTSSFLPPYAPADTDTTPSSSSSGSSYSPLLSFPSVDLELISLNSQSYTSLKDILPTTSLVNSPTPTGPSSATGYEIPIRNHLVKQAAWAYLQPMVASPTSSSRPFSQLFDCGLIPVLTRAFHQLLIHLRIRPSSRFL
ncbi:hypothetical protein QQ045_023287 [Rhodiola kirilowii]